MNHTLIIAEAGVNHNGSIDLAKKLIDAAAEANADYVKFQTFKASKLVSAEAQKAEYQTSNTGKPEESQLQMLEKLQLSEDDHYLLIDYCKQKNIRFLSTAFDMESLEFLHKIGLSLYKVPSGEITNLPYLRRIAEIAHKIILSTGMSTIEEIADAVTAIKEKSDAEITILHCNTEYPTPFADVNLLAMNDIRNRFGLSVGYSDHTLGIEVPVAAVAIGATVIEKHFTLDRLMPGPDHAASLEPGELKNMVTAIRNIEQALGKGLKQPSSSEIKNKVIARKSIHLARNKSAGEIIAACDLEMLRPGDGISPMQVDKVVGLKVNKDLLAGYKLTYNDFL